MQGLPQWVKGITSRQAHTNLPPGTVEEEHGRQGFYGPASHLYRKHPPTDWTRVEGPAAHHALNCVELSETDSLWPMPLLTNEDVHICFHRREAGREEFLRNVDGDELHFVHSGTGLLRTEYGPLRYRRGDYLLVPRGTTYRFELAEPTQTLVVESREGLYALPDRGLLGRHALFDPAMLEVPDAEAVDEDGEFCVAVKRGDQTTYVTYPFHPCDVIGWKGDVAPMRINVSDFRPVISPRYHLPPSVHTTFECTGFVVCTFAPRPGESDPDAIKLPFYHRNIDYDEVIFYHSGDFMSRAGIDAGMLTFHPAGLHHGPQPQAVERAALAPAGRELSEYAIMIDAHKPLTVTDVASEVDVPGYVASWTPD